MDGKQHRESLCGLAVPAGFFQLLEQNGVCLAKRLEPRRGDRAEAAHGQSGTREGVPPDEVFRQCEFQAEAADLVLEQVLERLDQLKT